MGIEANRRYFATILIFVYAKPDSTCTLSTLAFQERFTAWQNPEIKNKKPPPNPSWYILDSPFSNWKRICLIKIYIVYINPARKGGVFKCLRCRMDIMSQTLHGKSLYCDKTSQLLFLPRIVSIAASNRDSVVLYIFPYQL